MEHTPGPWTLEGQRVVGSEGGTVALLTNPLHGNGEIMDWPRHGRETENATAAHLSAEANARLVAAAPELLGTMKNIQLEASDAADGADNPYNVLESIDKMARAAIEEARK